MFNQLHDMSYWLMRERLADLERDLLSAEQDEATASAIDRVADHLGDMLLFLGARLKHQSPCPDTTREMAWLDRK